MKCVCALSGGMDSSTALAVAVDKHGAKEVLAVGFYYGSRHGRWENIAAKKVADYYSVPFRLLDLSAVMGSFKSALIATDERPIPEGHYEEENMRQTVVPNRNMIFLSILTGIAVSEGCSEVWLGAHAGDFACYPDCRPAFIEAMQNAIGKATKWEDNEPGITLECPFLYTNKLGILKAGFALTAPPPYQYTRTCYTDNEVSCGRCGACCERRESFQLLGIEDPIPYQYTGPLPKKPE